MMKDFSIFDAENSIEIMVICEYSPWTHRYEVVYKHAIDYYSGYPITLSSVMDYSEQINTKLKEFNYGH